MAKKQEAEQTAAAAENALTAAENALTAAEETVTLSKAAFEELLADVKLMKDKLANEERLRGASNEKLLAEQAELERVQRENEKAMELVDLHVELGNMRGSKNIEVSLNGKQYLIPRGQTVQVPRCVAEIVENAKVQRDAALGLQDRRAAELARQELEMAQMG